VSVPLNEPLANVELSFCRKATMAKSPSTPQHSSMTSSPHDVVSMGQLVHNSSLPHASSYADFESPVHGHHTPPHYAHRHGIPTTVPYEYHGHTVPGQQAHDKIVHRAAAIWRQAYYVTEQENPGAATITSSLRAHYHLSQQVEQPTMEMLYSASGIPTWIQSSHSTFSATSVPSPMVQDGFYTHQPTTKPAYLTAEAQLAMVQNHQPVQHRIAQPQKPFVSQPQHLLSTAEHYRPPSSHPQQEQ
jgi:hypothetical protein